MTNSTVVETALRHFADPAARSAYFDIYDPAIVLHGYAGVEPGLASVKAFYAALWAAFPDARVEVEEMLDAGDRVVVRFVLAGTHHGPFQGLPATGRSFRMPGITILRFVSGRCVERWSSADFLGLMAQLGAWPPQP